LICIFLLLWFLHPLDKVHNLINNLYIYKSIY